MGEHAKMAEDPAFENWIDRQYQLSAQAMLPAISATHLTKTRPGFGQTIVPKRGSIIASPVLADWDPDPDYFFHWFRDSAIVIDALRVLHAGGMPDIDAVTHFRDFVEFSLALNTLDGRPLVDDPSWRERTQARFRQYLRPDAELAAIRPDTVVAETRVNPDATLDISRWSRPQHDGPALRVIAVLRWLAGMPALDPAITARAALLLRADIDFLLLHAGEPDFDMWEEERGHNYYSLRLSATALAKAALWLKSDPLAETCRATAATLQHRLDEFWLESRSFYRSRLSGAPNKFLDISVIFAAIHAGGVGPLHSIRDVRMLATLDKLDDLFDRLYPINRSRPKTQAPALGRYEGDVYFSGGAYYFSTLAAAEFCYRLAGECSGDLAKTYSARGDAYLATVRAYTPEDGALSEQFDQKTGIQTSARQLAWSHAAFITAVAARRRCREHQ
ncbi:glycoside hydrolase family 15 protein [Taklimakanibacter lacteus]|uniref:glycoside hydrolase family 15 protein n=1 Tax=Taklimakanibacter lacteus TaxID=2268456 RepID=UPI000E6605B5